MTAKTLDASDIKVTGRQPDRVLRVAVEGGRVAVYVYGDRHAETILCINGGPGVSSQYMRDSFSVLADRGYQMVMHDQLGTGASDRPDDPRLWTMGRYVSEVEAVRRAVGGDKVHLLGHSWGGWLGIEYAVTHPEKLKSCVFSSTSASMPVHIAEIRRLLGEFGAETLAMVDRLETAGQLNSPLYRAICTLCSTAAIPRGALIWRGRQVTLTSTCRFNWHCGDRRSFRYRASWQIGTDCRICSA